MIEQIDFKAMPNLAKAVIAVMREVDGVEKNMTVGSGKNSYSGVADKDVKQVYKKAMADNGLCILPIGIDEETQIDRWDANYNGNLTKKQSVFVKVKTRYLLMHESGESVVITGYGHGTDSQDKAAGKATTYALKYALLYTFMTPTGAIDDTDKEHSESKPIPESKPKPTPKTPKPEPKQATQTESVKIINAHLDNTLTKPEGFQAQQDYKTNPERVKNFLKSKKFTVDGWKFITGEEWNGGDAWS